MGENDQKEQNSSYRIIKSWGCKVKEKKGGGGTPQKRFEQVEDITGWGNKKLLQCYLSQNYFKILTQL